MCDCWFLTLCQLVYKTVALFLNGGKKKKKKKIPNGTIKKHTLRSWILMSGQITHSNSFDSSSKHKSPKRRQKAGQTAPDTMQQRQIKSRKGEQQAPEKKRKSFPLLIFKADSCYADNLNPAEKAGPAPPQTIHLKAVLFSFHCMNLNNGRRVGKANTRCKH